MGLVHLYLGRLWVDLGHWGLPECLGQGVDLAEPKGLRWGLGQGTIWIIAEQLG